MRDSGLLSSTPWYEIRPKENSKAAGWSSIIYAASPIGFSEDTQQSGWWFLQKKSHGSSPFNKPENVLDSFPMDISGLGKKLTYFVNNNGQIWLTESKVLRSSHCTMIYQRILVTQRHTIVSRQMFNHTRGGGNRLIILHVNSMKNILCILVLSEHHSPKIGNHLDAKKVIQGTKVLDRKRGRQLLKQALSSKSWRANNHNIVYIDKHVDSEITRVEHK
jgi:hypothetical protein